MRMQLILVSWKRKKHDNVRAENTSNKKEVKKNEEDVKIFCSLLQVIQTTVYKNDQ